MTFAQAAIRPNSRKIVLLELDIGQEWAQWFNRYAGAWYVNFDNLYPLIDASFRTGCDTSLEITRIGSVKVDGLSLSPVSGAEDVQLNDSSFYYHAASKTLYVHCPGGDDPAIHRMVVGEAYGICNQAGPGNRWGVYGGFAYEPRLLSAPAISKKKDPLFFGKVAFTGGEVTIDNSDGRFDLFGENNDVFGNSARLLAGFDDAQYSDFRPIFAGFMDKMSIGRELRITIEDPREQLSREIPPNVWSKAAYPNIKDSQVDKPIPLGYGVLRNVPVVCTNEAEDPAPATFTFKLFDVADHPNGIKAIDHVYVEGVEVTPTATDLVNATFSLATADYDPGDQVTCDCRGFVDPAGDLIDNALAVLVDLLTTYYPIAFNNNFFDMARWETAGTPDIGLFIGKGRKLIEVIEDICATVQGTFLVMDDGRYAHRLFSETAAVRQTFQMHDVLEVPTVDYDPTEVLTSVRVGYNRDWANDELYEYIDRSQETAIFHKFKTYRSRLFETLLVNAGDAAAFASKILALSGDVRRVFTLRTKTQAIERELGDLIVCPVRRVNGEFLGDVKAEVIGVTRDATGGVVSLECRIIERLAATEHFEAAYWGDEFYGDDFWGVSGLREVS